MGYTEIYERCPFCGAVNNGSQYCGSCGALLVKQRGASITATPQEMANDREDAAYPRYYGQSAGVSKFLQIACPIAGGILGCNALLFLGVFFAVLAITKKAALFPLAIIGGVLFLMGIIAFIPLIVSHSNYNKCRKNGREFTGIVRSYENTSIMVNHRRVLNVRLLIHQAPQPYILVMNSNQTDRVYPVGATVLIKEYNGRYMIMGVV